MTREWWYLVGIAVGALVVILVSLAILPGAWGGGAAGAAIWLACVASYNIGRGN